MNFVSLFVRNIISEYHILSDTTPCIPRDVEIIFGRAAICTGIEGN